MLIEISGRGRTYRNYLHYPDSESGDVVIVLIEFLALCPEFLHCRDLSEKNDEP